MTFGPETYVLVGLLLVAVVVISLGAMQILRRRRAKRLKALREDSQDPAHARDRAFNRLTLARREATLLSAQGIEVERAEQLIGLAGRSLESREYDRAFELAQSAHETLVKSRGDAPLFRPKNPSSPATTAGRAADGPDSPPAAPMPVAPVPKNRAESQFQLRLLEQDLAQAPGRGTDAAEVEQARGLYVEAQGAFARGEFGEAFRLSLKGRRTIGGKVESLGGSSAGAVSSSVAAPGDAAQLAEKVAGGGRCSRCGHPTVAGDGYCRGCGAPIAPAGCPKCGAPRLPTDTFCGKCGERYAVG